MLRKDIEVVLSEVHDQLVHAGHDFGIPAKVWDGVIEELETQERPDEKELGPFARESETSRKAALANYPRSGTQRQIILMHIVIAGKRGKTREELENTATHLTGNSIRPRVKELIDGEWVEVTDQTRKTRDGQDAEVLVATQKAIEALERNEGISQNKVIG